MNKGKRLLIAGCGLLAILSSCKDNPGNLGPKVLPNSDLIYTYETDTTTVVTSMYLKDSAVTNDLNTCLLGSFNDPVFGETKASIYAEVFPANVPTLPDWANNYANRVKVDSSVMVLMLSGTAYGDNAPQTYAVYQLAADVDTGRTYYSDASIQLSSNTPIGEAQITPRPLTTSNDTLRIKLTGAFTTNFTHTILGGGITKNGFTGNWSEYFNSAVIHGVYITTLSPLQLPGQGGMVSVNLNTATSGIYVYYHSISTDSLYSTYFPVGGITGQYFDNFTHNYSTSVIGAAHPYGPRDSVPAPQLIYIQSTGGTLGRINFPYLQKTWSKLGPIVVNEALLTLPIDEQYVTGNYMPPAQLYLVGTGSNWTGYTLPDQGQPYYGGAITNNTYPFVITQYIQSIIDGKNDSDRGLYIIPGNTNTVANNVVLYGAQHSKLPANKATLTIYYTPLKKP